VTAALGYRPLYRQVYDILIRKVAEGAWRPGEALPSEQALARDLGVSQGTIRKVLDALTAEKLLERRQGKGTFIAENTADRALFRFFKMARPGGERVIPACGQERAAIRAASAEECRKLEMPSGAQAIEIERVRLLDGRPAIIETIIVPAALFPDLEKRSPLPNTLYSLYQTDYGVNIIAADEEIKADLASEKDARLLGVAPGAPILCVDRVARALRDAKAEWRKSRIAAPDLVYAIALS
jgi:GntR family transcriptional regulator